MYFVATASMWRLTSLTKARRTRARSSSVCASSKRRKFSSGNLESTGTRPMPKFDYGVDLLPAAEGVLRREVLGGRIWASRSSSSSSPSPPRSFGARRICCSEAMSLPIS